MSDGQVDHIKTFMNTIRRSYKFMNMTTATSQDMVSCCLDFIGYSISNARDEENRKQRRIRRAKLVPAIFKLMTLALIDERAYITRCVKAKLYRKYMTLC